MGVYINMEMPENCALCPVWDAGNCLVATEAIICEYTKRPSDCPLVHVPPHGRLIDADALMKILSKVIDINASIEQRNEATDQERRCLWWFEQQIGIAPTILEAEEGE